VLIRANLINVAQQDSQMAHMLFYDPRTSLQDFAAGFIRECLISNPPVASQKQFEYTIQMFVQLSSAGRTTAE
jgi:CCR4-NOT transcription complex subunit 1